MRSTPDRLCRSAVVPHGILRRANDIWRQEHPDSFYGGSHKAMDPATYFDQQLGLVISTAVSSHLLRAHNKNKSGRPMECTGDDALAELEEGVDLDDALPLRCHGTDFWEGTQPCCCLDSRARHNTSRTPVCPR